MIRLLLLSVFACQSGPSLDHSTHSDALVTRIYRRPYLTQVTETAATITWASNRDAPSEVEVWAEGEDALMYPASREVLAAAMTGLGRDEVQYVARLEGLHPGTAYAYRARVGNATAGLPNRFQTARAADDVRPFAALVIGDSGKGSSAQTRIAQQMRERAFELVLHTGDIAYEDGTYAQFQTRVFDVYSDIFGRVPFFATLGNHEYRTDNAAPALKLLGEARYYSYNWGPVHFVSLDSNRVTEGMANWLADDLDATQRLWKVVYFHHPPYSSGRHGNNAQVQEMLVPVFAAHGVDLVMSGHDHTYERMKPMHGVQYIVTGGGGADLYAQRWDNDFTAKFIASYHFGLINVDGCRLSFTAIDDAGVQLDQVRLEKCN